MITKVNSTSRILNTSLYGEFGVDGANTSGLNFAVFGGDVTVDLVNNVVAGSTEALTDDATNAVYIDNAFAVGSSLFAALPLTAMALYRVTTVSGAITLVEDLRESYR